MPTRSSTGASTGTHDMVIPRSFPAWRNRSSCPRGLLHACHPVLRVGVLLSLLSGGAFSCSGDTLNGPSSSVSVATAYWTLQFTHHAINLALTPPYDTVQLTAVPRNAAGAPLAGLGQVTYTTMDSTVTVSPTGVVTARTVTPPGGTQVIATLQDRLQRVTHADTVFIQIVQTPPALPLKTFSLQPALGDSAKRSFDFTTNTTGFGTSGVFLWPVTVTDAHGDSVCTVSACALQVSYTSSNPAVATIDPHTGEVRNIDTGHVVFTAATLAYGVAERDSVAFTVGYALNGTVYMTLAILAGVLTVGFVAPRKLLLGVGAVVTFCNKTPQPVGIAFDNPAAVDTASCGPVNGVFAPPTGSGDIPAFGGVMQLDTVFNPNGSINTIDTLYNNPADAVCRRFNKPGVYHYHSSVLPSDTFEIDIK
jgi:hypothetical protein